MIKSTETSDFVVYDDVLEQEQFLSVWQAVQAEDYSMPHIGGWSKVWRLTDGACIGSKNYETENAPFNNYMDLMLFLVKNAAAASPQIITNWKTLTLRSYLYPRGTKLSWHNDLGYEGAAIFYIHPEWGSTWGGELMIASTPPDFSLPAPHLDHKEEDKFLSLHGMGTYITAKPNRLVVTRPGVWHSINRVDDDAGDHCRATIVGFFKS
jgi:hypothetical protein